MPKLSKKLILSLSLIYVLLSVIAFSWYISIAKHQYALKATTALQQYLDQQSYLLQRLGQKLVPFLESANTQQVAVEISRFEDLIFALARQGLTIPVNLNLVSFDASRQIIGSHGIAQANDLAPDSEYYYQIVENPTQLAISALYVNPAMPDLQLLNLGIGILDAEKKYYGHLDLKISVSALQAYLAQKIMANNLYSFEIKNTNQLGVAVSMHTMGCLVFVLQYFLLTSLLLTLVITGVVLCINISKKNKIIADLKVRLDSAKQCLLLQQNYNQQTIVATQSQKMLIDMQELLSEVKVLNDMHALDHQVKIQFPHFDQQPFRFYGNKQQLLAILSGMLYEIISSLHNGATIELKVTIKHETNELHKIIFSFIDNGFYNKLEDSEINSAFGDIRCKGWGNIARLVAAENGNLEHIHTVYCGNKINLQIISASLNNVIKLNALERFSQ